MTERTKANEHTMGIVFRTLSNFIGFWFLNKHMGLGHCVGTSDPKYI